MSKKAQLLRYFSNEYEILDEFPSFDAFLEHLRANPDLLNAAEKKDLDKFTNGFNATSEIKLRKKYAGLIEETMKKIKKELEEIKKVQPHGKAKANPKFMYAKLSKEQKKEFDKLVSEMVENTRFARAIGGDRKMAYKVNKDSKIPKYTIEGRQYNKGNLIDAARAVLLPENIETVRNSVILPELQKIEDIQNSAVDEETKQALLDVAVVDLQEGIDGIMEVFTPEEVQDIERERATLPMTPEVLTQLEENPQLARSIGLLLEVAGLNLKGGGNMPGNLANTVFNMASRAGAPAVGNYVRDIESYVKSGGGVPAAAALAATGAAARNLLYGDIENDDVVIDIGENPSSTLKTSLSSGVNTLIFTSLGALAAAVLAGGIYYYKNSQNVSVNNRKTLEKLLGVSSDSLGELRSPTHLDAEKQMELLKSKKIIPPELTFDKLVEILDHVPAEDLNNLEQNRLTPREFFDNVVSFNPSTENPSNIKTFPGITPLDRQISPSGLRNSQSESSGLRSSRGEPSGLRNSQSESSGLRNSQSESSGLRNSQSESSGFLAPPQTLTSELDNLNKTDSIPLPPLGQLRFPTQPPPQGINNNYTKETSPNIMSFQTPYKNYEDLPEYMKVYITPEEFSATMKNEGSINRLFLKDMKGYVNNMNGLMDSQLPRVPTESIPIARPGRFLSSFPSARANASPQNDKIPAPQFMIGTGTHLQKGNRKLYKNYEYGKAKISSNQELIGSQTSLIKKVKKIPLY